MTSQDLSVTIVVCVIVVSIAAVFIVESIMERRR